MTFRKESFIQLTIVIIWTVLTSCDPMKEVAICHLPTGRCIQIVDDGTSRIIFFNAPLKSQFVKLDISRINKVTDGIFVCFNENTIDVVNPKSQILETQIDSTNFSFSTQMELNNNGLPNILKFHQDNCFEFNMGAREIFPKSEDFTIN